jgi:cytochrome c-type biogenesis protein CcmH/NrfF
MALMNKRLAVLVFAVCTLSVFADVAVEHQKRRTSPLVWMVPVAVAIGAAVIATNRRRNRRSQQ